MTMNRKKWLIGGGALLACIVIVFGGALWLNRPDRTIREFLEAVKKQDKAKVESMISADITDTRKEDISFFTDDWVSDSTTVYTLGTEHASWRLKAGGKDYIPTPRYFAHFYEQYATVAFDDYEDPVVIRVRREGNDASSIFAQLFRPWKVVDIEYQPDVLDDSSDYDNSGVDINSDDGDVQGIY